MNGQVSSMNVTLCIVKETQQFKNQLQSQFKKKKANTKIVCQK